MIHAGTKINAPLALRNSMLIADGECGQHVDVGIVLQHASQALRHGIAHTLDRIAWPRHKLIEAKVVWVFTHVARGAEILL